MGSLKPTRFEIRDLTSYVGGVAQEELGLYPKYLSLQVTSEGLSISLLESHKGWFSGFLYRLPFHSLFAILSLLQARRYAKPWGY